MLATLSFIVLPGDETDRVSITLDQHQQDSLLGGSLEPICNGFTLLSEFLCVEIKNSRARSNGKCLVLSKDAKTLVQRGSSIRVIYHLSRYTHVADASFHQ
jgi:hypothetical protein